MRIAVTADPELPVPPRHYGGIERIVGMLVEGLVARGHEVLLFAHRDSNVSCELAAYPGMRSGSGLDAARNAALLTRRVLGGRFDVVHSFGRLAYLAPLAWHPVRKVMSYQRAITRSSVIRARRLFGRSVEFTACSRYMIADVQSLGSWHVVYNGVPMKAYTFEEGVAPDAPVVFLGRIEEIKGPHLAIEAARQAGRSIVLAGTIAPEHQGYFEARIRPLIDDSSVKYIGPVDDRGKNALLGGAAALLMPILWDEPFGIVMAEALACGTPVIGLARGAVPEVVADGVTGYLAGDLAGLVDGIRRVAQLDRRRCRAEADQRFSDRVVVDDYESLYRTMAPQTDLVSASSPGRP